MSPVRAGMSTRAAVCAAAPIAGQPGTMHVRPAVHNTHATSSAAQREIAVRPKSAGARTVGKNRKAPNDTQSVSATVNSTPRMLSDAYSEPAGGGLRRPPRRETQVEGSMSKSKLAAGAAVLAVGLGGVATTAVSAAP